MTDEERAVYISVACERYGIAVRSDPAVFGPIYKSSAFAEYDGHGCAVLGHDVDGLDAVLQLVDWIDRERAIPTRSRSR